MVFESRWILEHIERNGVPVDSIRFSGGGSRSPLWCQMHADILGRSVTRVGTRYTTGVGAAICAGLGVGLFVDAKVGVTALSRMAESYEPDSSTAAVYDHLYTLFRATFSALRQANVFEGLHALHVGKPLA